MKSTLKDKSYRNHTGSFENTLFPAIPSSMFGSSAYCLLVCVLISITRGEFGYVDCSRCDADWKTPPLPLDLLPDRMPKWYLTCRMIRQKTIPWAQRHSRTSASRAEIEQTHYYRSYEIERNGLAVGVTRRSVRRMMLLNVNKTYLKNADRKMIRLEVYIAPLSTMTTMTGTRFPNAGRNRPVE